MVSDFKVEEENLKEMTKQLKPSTPPAPAPPAPAPPKLTDKIKDKVNNFENLVITRNKDTHLLLIIMI